MKRVEFKSSASAVAKVNDTNVQDNVTLGTYMTLPAEQWITLDDRYISRLDAPSDNTNAVQYRFTLPLKHFMQLPLTATCDVSVNIDESSRLLRLEATGAKLRPSTAEDEELPAPNMTEGNMTKVAPPTLPPNFTQSIEQADMEVAFKTRVKWQETGSTMFGQDQAAQLDLKTEVLVKMTLPPPLSFLPSFLLKQAGGLVLKAACVTILPRFGELVAEDYRRWSRGLPRVGGSLAPSPSTLQQLEGDPYYFPPPATSSVPPSSSTAAKRARTSPCGCRAPPLPLVTFSVSLLSTCNNAGVDASRLFSSGRTRTRTRMGSSAPWMTSSGSPSGLLGSSMAVVRSAPVE